MDKGNGLFSQKGNFSMYQKVKKQKIASFIKILFRQSNQKTEI